MGKEHASSKIISNIFACLQHGLLQPAKSNLRVVALGGEPGKMRLCFFFLKKRLVFYCLPSEVEGVLCGELRPRLQAHDVALGELGHVQAVHLLESAAKIRGEILKKYQKNIYDPKQGK